MNWHAIASFSLGFAMMPATWALIFGFSYLGVTYNLDKSIAFVGGVVGLAILVIGLTSVVAFISYRGL